MNKLLLPLLAATLLGTGCSNTQPSVGPSATETIPVATTTPTAVTTATTTSTVSTNMMDPDAAMTTSSMMDRGATMVRPSSTPPAPAMEPKNKVPTSTPASPPTAEPKKPAPATSAPQPLNITINGGNFFFAPTNFTVKKGQLVRLTFKNSGGFHDLVIDELNVATRDLGNGEEQTVEFTPDRTGSFEYYCAVGNHRAMGMRGSLIVTE